MGAGKSKSKKKNDPPPASKKPGVATVHANTSTTSSTSSPSAAPPITTAASPAAAKTEVPSEPPKVEAASPSNVPVAEAKSVPASSPENDLASIDAHEIATDLFSIMNAFRVVATDFAAAEAPFGSPDYLTPLKGSNTRFMEACEPLVNPKKLAMWVRPLHPYQTGVMAARAKAVAADYQNLKAYFSRFEKDCNDDPGAKSALREGYKSLLGNLVHVYTSIEIAFPEYLAAQVDCTSTAVQQCLEQAMANDIGRYESAYRVCITENMKLARIANSKGLQSMNVDVHKELSDSSFTSVRASSVLSTLGKQYLSEGGDQITAKMSAITKGLVSQYSKIMELAKVTGTQTDSVFTPEMIAAYHAAYDAAHKFLEDGCIAYEATPDPDQTIITIVKKLLTYVADFKESLTVPNSRQFSITVGEITRLIQLLCIHVSTFLGPEMEAPFYHMIMNAMFCCVHYTIQLNLTSAGKCLYHPIIPPELTALSAIRLLFASLSVTLVNACTIFGSTQNAATGSVTEDNYESLDMVTASASVMHPSIVDILHYGRPLIIREAPTFAPSPQEETVSSILKDMDELVGLTSPEPAKETKPAAASTPTPAATPANTNPLGAAPTLTPPPITRKDTITTGGSRPSLAEFGRTKDEPAAARATSPSATPTPATASTPASNPLGQPPTTASTSVKQTTLTPPPTTVAAPSSSTPASGAGGSSDSGAPPGAPTPWTTMPADSITEENLPPGYPPIPPKVGAFKREGSSEAAYKQWMVDRYNREAAENALIVYKRKLKAAQESIGIK